MRTIVELRELLALVNLEDISYLELSGQVRTAEAVPDTDTDSADMEIPLRIQTRQDSTSIGVRLAVDIDLPNVSMLVDVTARYSLAEEIELPETTMRDFVERVALGHIYPYARQAVSDLAWRLRVTVPPLPIIQLAAGLLKPQDASSQEG